MTPIRLHDVTLRDGNHALRHKLTAVQVAEYCQRAELGQIHSLEVGHGNGLGASSFLVGKASSSDSDLLGAARAHLSSVKLGVHVIPGFATYQRDISRAIDLGVDFFRIAAHVTEADVCAPQIEKLASSSIEVFGVLMMTHMATSAELAVQASKLQSYGASGVVFMDSAGALTPKAVSERVLALRDTLDSEVAVGFHAHNNLGFGLANAIAAANAGATIIDGSSAGLGAGAGNVHLELIGAWLENENLMSEEDLELLLEMTEFVETEFADKLPRISSQSVRSGLAGAFSGYSPQVRIASEAHNVSPQAIWREIGRRKLVAGQESAVWEIAQDLANL